MYFCKDWYINVHAKEGITYYNFFIIGILLILTFRTLLNWITDLLYPPPVCPTSQANCTRERMANIEFLRVLFTMEILLCHFIMKLYPNITNGGWLSIIPFFIMSGFFLTMTFSSKVSFSAFASKKLVQFLPLVALGCALDCLFIPKINESHVIATLFLLSGTGVFPQSAYCFVSWFVSVLFWVSLLYFYLLKTKNRESVNTVFGLIVFFGVVALAKISPITSTFLGNKGDIGNLVSMLIVTGMTLVAVGYFIHVAYVNSERNKLHSMKCKLFFTLLELFVLIYAFALMHVKKIYFPHWIIQITVYSTLIMLFLLKKGYISCFFNQKIWIILGKYSMATYLVQGLVVWKIFPYVLKYNKDYIMDHKLLTIVLVLVACWIVGIWAHYVIERPAAQFLKKAFGK